MKTRSEFLNAIVGVISDYPSVAALYRAGDPLILAPLNAMAAVLALMSAEQDVAAAEPFTKARDMTVLADAVVKGVLPFGKPATVVLAITNANPSTPVTILTGRKLLDPQGRKYTVTVGATIAGGGTGEITAIQHEAESFTHTVTLGAPFYKILIPKSDELIESIQVTNTTTSTAFVYKKDFVNVGAGDEVFHLESDTNRRISVVFGITDIAGYQPVATEVFSVQVYRTEGYFELGLGSPFEFETIASPLDARLSMTLSEMANGSAPMSVTTLREVCSYPSLYDTSAVYKGNFDFLIRRNLPDLRFLSVWNEQKEEEVRGADIGNINTLFVTAKKDLVSQPLLESEITAIIRDADDSYRVQFVAIDEQAITAEITAYIAPVYDSAEVTSAIQDVVLAEFGPDSPFAKRGGKRVNNKKLITKLAEKIPALQDVLSDVTAEITEPVGPILPESYRYINSGSLTIVVQPVEA